MKKEVQCLHCLRYRMINTKGASAEWYQRIAPYCRKCTYIVHPEIGEKISKANKGKVGWNKGQKLSEAHKQKLKENHRGCTGIAMSEETKKKIGKANSISLKGNIPWNKGLHPDYLQGEKHFNWKGGVTGRNQKERVLFRQTIYKEILERDNYTCQLCGAYGVDLQVDHIQSWAEYMELRFSMDNCRTLCAKCHYKITFGREMPESVRTWGRNLVRRVEK